MNNPLKNIDKAKAGKIALDSMVVGVYVGVGYFLSHLDPIVFGSLSVPIAMAITFGLKALKKYLPNDADVVTPTVGSLKVRQPSEADMRRLQAIAALERTFHDPSFEGLAVSLAEDLQEPRGVILAKKPCEKTCECHKALASYLEGK